MGARRAIVERYAKHLSAADLQRFAALSGGFSGRDIKEVCEHAERRWVAKLIRKEVSASRTHRRFPNTNSAYGTAQDHHKTGKENKEHPTAEKIPGSSRLLGTQSLTRDTTLEVDECDVGSY